jgi:muconolactone delta-isomerase
MQFLIITKQSSPPPPQMILPLMDAFKAWLAEHRGSGKLKSAWVFSGTPGGGGVLDVDSHEELDQIMKGYPLIAFSSTEVIAISDLDRSIEAGTAAFHHMMEMMGSRDMAPD